MDEGNGNLRAAAEVFGTLPATKTVLICASTSDRVYVAEVVD